MRPLGRLGVTYARAEAGAAWPVLLRLVHGGRRGCLILRPMTSDREIRGCVGDRL